MDLLAGLTDNKTLLQGGLRKTQTAVLMLVADCKLYVIFAFPIVVL